MVGAVFDQKFAGRGGEYFRGGQNAKNSTFLKHAVLEWSTVDRKVDIIMSTFLSGLSKVDNCVVDFCVDFFKSRH